MAADLRAVVQALIAEADRRAAADLDEKVHKGEALARLLADREGLQYKTPSVRAWMRGDAMPPADVLLAVARSVGMSIDEQASRRPADTEPPPSDRLEALESQVATLSEVVKRLEAEAVKSEVRARRRAWARGSSPSDSPDQSIPGSRPASRGRGM
jgi:transcriptional regulator with XRE-family HTH domain